MSILSRTMRCLAFVGSLITGFAVGAPESVKSGAEVLTANEKLALRRLHHNAVEIFVDRPGFGVRRLMMNVDDLVSSPKSLAEVKARPPLADQENPSTNANKKPSHYAVQDLLVERAGRFPTDEGKESWQLRHVHLIGLVKQAKPAVYLLDGNPKKPDEPTNPKLDIPSRDMNAFERAALEAIRDGEPLVAEKSNKDMRLLAPIFAGKRCTTCHEQGLLLGAFTYELERVAYNPEKDGVRPPRGR